MSKDKKTELLQRKLELLRDLRNIDSRMKSLEQGKRETNRDLIEVKDALMQQGVMLWRDR